MPKYISNEIKQEAIRLRVENRLGLDAIHEATKLAIGTLSTLLQPYPLSEEEVHDRMKTGAERGRRGRKPYHPVLSKYAEMIHGEAFSRSRKAQIAEAAILFRLALFGYETWKSAFEGNRVDWLVTKSGVDRSVRLQVRWARKGRHGRPFVSLRRQHGRTRITLTDCDFVVGYDLDTDTAFVIPITVVAHKSTMTFCDPKYAEAWTDLFGKQDVGELG